ncbi:MAG: hypothetical protein Q8S33_05355 [Myxococcales bacterium]|nr:hypothetical protein [Myxococcales bacterium]MDP3499734.1 hypothetical protein [Myxococcales bacterium]
MLRLTLLALLLTLAGCRTEPRACVKMKELCGTEAQTCRDLRDDVTEHFGQGAVDTLDGCVLSANTCSQAAGCVSGEAAKATLSAATDFMNAFADTVNPAHADDCVKNARTASEAAGCRAGALGKSLAESAEAFAEGVKKTSR